MMAMTPYEKKTLEEIESAFFEAVESRVPPSVHVAKKTKQQIKTKSTPTGAPRRRGWFGGLKEKMVMTFVCCAPPQTLLDDDEIQEILARIEEPVKPSVALPPRAPSRKDTLMRRNSASVMPATRVVDTVPVLEKPSLSDITHVLNRSESIDEERVSVVEAQVVAPRAHVSLRAMQRVVVTLLALHKTVETRQTERAVLAVQMKWRRRQIAPTTPNTLSASATPVTATPITATPAIATPTTAAEPDLEPKTVDEHSAPSPVSPKRRRSRKLGPKNKKTKFATIPHAVTQETAHAVESLNQLALTRKRLRSVDLESRAPCVDVERDVHVLFGEEEIDDDDEVAELELTCRAPQPMASIALQRCASVPPPPTAFRPRPVKSKSLLEAQAASTVQRAWRNMKARQQREIQRRLAEYETQKQSVMPTIRNKMLELRKRLEEMQERNGGAIVAASSPEPVVIAAPLDDDYDWL